MLCEKPFKLGSLPVGCQRCLPCLINRRRVWAARLLLERKVHQSSCVVTLTYRPESVPSGGNLRPKDVQDWLKRLRSMLSPRKIRFFLAGEYGEKNGRPHYHCALFGVSALDIAGPDVCIRGGSILYYSQSSPLARSWGLGFVSAGELTEQSAKYICGYVTKKIESIGGRDDGRVPEFNRMSLRPGIGGESIKPVVAVLSSEVGVQYLLPTGDVPHSFRFGGRLLPIGRYVRGKLRQALGISQDGSSPPGALLAYCQEELPRVRREYEALAAGTEKTGQQIMIDTHLQKLRNVAARFKIKNQRRSL